jgi:alpha-ribazole phosphatase
MLELLIVRHGESEGNAAGMFTGHGPSPLTARGLRQAEAVGAALCDPRPDAVYVSDLPRAVQTAQPLLARAGVEPILAAEIRERDMGIFVGMRFEELQAQHPDGWQAIARRDGEYCPPGGESHRACCERVARFLDGLRARHTQGRVVLVSHGVAIHHMLWHLLGRGGAHTVFVTDNCCVHRIEVHADGRVRIVALNDTRHLAGL